MTESEKKESLWPIAGILAFLYLLHFMPFIAKSFRFWGFNHLVFLPFQYAILFAIVGFIVILAPFIPVLSSWGVKVSDLFAKVFFESTRKTYYRLGFVLVAGFAFFLFRMPTHFLGDGYQYLSNIGSDKGSFIKWSEGGITYLAIGVQSLLGPKNFATALLAFQIISIISGMVSIWFYFSISGLLSSNSTMRAIIFMALICSGSALLFFGYVESYSAVWAIMTAFLKYTVQYLKTRKGLITAIVLYFAALILHALFIIFFPALVYLVFQHENLNSIYRKYKKLIFLLIAGALIAMAILFVMKWQSDLYFQNIFLTLFQGKPIDPSYYLFSVSHILDIINILLLLSPLLPLLVWFAGKRLWPAKTDSIAIFLFLFSAGALAFLIVIDPSLTMPRDWDLFSFSTIGPTLLALAVLSNKAKNSLPKVASAILIVLPLFALPYLLTNLTENGSVKYISSVIDLDQPKSRGTLTILRDYYIGRNGSLADSINIEIENRYANFGLLRRALKMISSDDLPAAEQIMASIKPDKYSKDYHNMLCLYYMSKGNFSLAKAEAQKAIQLQKYYPRSYLALAWASAGEKDYETALAALKEARNLDNRDNEVLSFLASIYFNVGKFDSTIFYAQSLIKSDSLDMEARYWLAMAQYRIGQMDASEKNAAIFLTLGHKHPDYEYRRNQFIKIFPGLGQ